MKCNDEQRFESFCKFACKTGYMLTEASMKAGNGMVCQADRTWKGEVIECESKLIQRGKTKISTRYILEYAISTSLPGKKSQHFRGELGSQIGSFKL